MPKSISLNFAGILEIALKGVRRSSVFLGLGTNAAIDPSYKAYQLTKLAQIQLIPDDLPTENVEHFKAEFRTWIEANALREAAESFTLFLDGVHRACSIVHAVKNNVRTKELHAKQAKFANEGLPNKLNILDQRFGIRSTGVDHLVLLNRARACLTHRKGRVGPEDVKEQTQFTVAWIGLDVFIEKPNGERVFVNEIPEGGFIVEEGGTLKIAPVKRMRSFGDGTMLSFSPRDLAEICWFYVREARAITASAVAYAEANGAKVRHVDSG